MKSITRLVLDSNVLLSASFFRGSIPWKAVRKALQSGELLFSKELLNELEEVFARSKYDRYVPYDDRKKFLDVTLEGSLHLDTKTKITACRDPKDNMLLELAVDGKADCIITEDKDVLVLHPFRNIKILSPADFLKT